MKKVLITMAVLTGMVAGGMVFSSFATQNQVSKKDAMEIVMNDDGWEDYAVVMVCPYIK